MPNTLPISRLINVAVDLSPLAAQAQDISTLLVLGNTDVIDVVERIRTYETIADVAADFGTTVPEYYSALLWFQQAPQPTQIKIGRWAQTASKGRLNCGTLSAAQQAIALWNAYATPGFYVKMDDIPLAILPGSFAAETNLNGIASLIEAQLPAGATCDWNATLSRFEILSSTTGAASSVSFLEAPTAVGDITFAVNPLNLATITLNGTVVTFKAAGPLGANEVLIGATLADTLAALQVFLAASADAEIVKFETWIDPTDTKLLLKAAAAGAGGDALTIAASVATPSGATLTGGTATSIATAMAGLSTSSGAYVADGIGAEAADTAVALFDSYYGQTWYGLMMPTAINADHLLVAAYIEAATNKHIYGITTQEAGVLSAVTTTDIAYQMEALAYKRTMVQYSSSTAYAVASLFGRALTINYNGNNTVITLMYKQEPGITAENLTSTQLAALEAKMCNVFVAYNNSTAIIEQGRMSSGNFIDELTGTDWLALTIQTALYNLLYTTTTKIPQTDAGMHLLMVTCEATCSQAVTNGLLAAGVWNANGFGQLESGSFLPKGFYVYAPPVSSQTQADREARMSVPIQIAAKLAGAVHTIDVTITVNR